MESVFTVKTVDLQESLTRIKRFNKKYFKEGIIKIRMMPGGIELSTIGVFEFVHGQTEGLAEVFAPLKLLFAFAQDCTHDSVTFKFRKGELECGNSIFSSPHISIKDWWNEWKKDRKVNKILDKLKDDPEIVQFLNLPNYQQKGKWQKLIKTKLKDDELDLLTSISRDRVKRGKI